MTELEQKLSDAGYKRHTACDTEEGKFFQKCFKDPLNRKLYYLDAYYDPPKQLTHILLPEIIHWCVQLHLDNGNYFDVDYYTTDINEAEQFFEKMFDSMECVPAWCVE